MSELTYEKDGFNVKTSTFLKNRGSCCKTSCLHCPYGFTIEKEGLEILPITDDNFLEAKEIAPRDKTGEVDVAASLLASAFGNQKTKEVLTEKNKNLYLLVKLKGETCAVAKTNGSSITEIYHKKYFENQGITLDEVSRFAFLK